MIRTANLTLPEPDRREILRYMGCRESSAEIEALIDRSLDELESAFQGRVCYCELDVSVSDGEVDLGFARICSRSLAKNLAGCDRVIIFAATVGIEIDRRVARYGRTEPAMALCMQAIGAERIEALCDEFCKTLVGARPRFSPGYGDLPLEFQKDIFRLLCCPARIGLTLSDSLLMSPTKSVTAIVGIGKETT